MVRYPEGINGDFFYQKECPPQSPDWVTRYSDLYSSSGLTYAICIKVHAWATSRQRPGYPDWAVFDLDPNPPSGLKEAIQVAVWIGEILKELKMLFLVKTSGSSGIHILLPLIPQYSYKKAGFA